MKIEKSNAESLIIIMSVLFISFYLLYEFTTIKYWNWKFTGTGKTCNSKFISKDIGAFICDLQIEDYRKIKSNSVFEFKPKTCWLENRLLYPNPFCSFKKTDSKFPYSIIIKLDSSDIFSYSFGWKLLVNEARCGFELDESVLFADISDTSYLEKINIYVLSNEKFNFTYGFDTIASFRVKKVNK